MQLQEKQLSDFSPAYMNFPGSQTGQSFIALLNVASLSTDGAKIRKKNESAKLFGEKLQKTVDIAIHSHSVSVVRCKKLTRTRVYSLEKMRAPLTPKIPRLGTANRSLRLENNRLLLSEKRLRLNDRSLRSIQFSREFNAKQPDTHKHPIRSNQHQRLCQNSAVSPLATQTLLFA